jgi:pimeloyl-ACP methyl ester carboxylesterase
VIEVGELSVRTRSSGGKVADKVNGDVPNGLRRLVLLIHGFANSQNGASESFAEFIANLESIKETAKTQFPVPVFKFFWPGDNRVVGISQITYSSEIPVAVDSAERLYEFFSGLAGPQGGPTEIYLVAHSLGSRVVLETLRYFARLRNDLLIFSSICLMAAAVPVSEVQDTHALLFASLLPARRQVLFSTSDPILWLAFRPGEALAGEGMSEAVGRRGEPFEIWNARWNCKGFGHHDYWKSPLAALQLAKLVGLPVTQPILDNAIVKREGPEKRQTLVAAPPETREVGVRR